MHTYIYIYIWIYIHIPWLFCNRSCIDTIDRFETCGRESLTALAETVTIGGQKKINGKKQKLKESQAYPAAFGYALSSAWEQNRRELMVIAEKNNDEAETLLIDWDAVKGPICTDEWEEFHPYDKFKLNVLVLFFYLGYANHSLPALPGKPKPDQ